MKDDEKVWMSDFIGFSGNSPAAEAGRYQLKRGRMIQPLIGYRIYPVYSR